MRAPAQVLSPDCVLGGRYRLTRLVGADVTSVRTGLWEAEDLILARPVALRTIVAATPQIREALFRAAARASGAGDPRIAATYDADEQDAAGPDGSGGGGRGQGGDHGGAPVAYLVREWVDGEPLRRHLRDGGLDPERLRALMRDTAEAVAALHAAGGWHGRIHPDNLLVRPDGSVRLTDPGTGLALAGAGVPPVGRDGRRSDPPPLPAATLADLGVPPGADGDPGGEPARLQAVQRADTCDLGRLFYAAATGTWVGGPWRGMPGAPSDGVRPRTPRQVRAAVPRDLDAVIRGILLPSSPEPAPLVRAADIAATLAPLGPADIPPPPAPAAPPARRRGRPLWAVAAAAVAAGVVLALAISRQPTRTADPLTAGPQQRASAPVTPPGGQGAAIALIGVTAFDPPPGDGEENDQEIPLSHDGSPRTAWLTERYTSAALGGLKPGVGLLVDLGAAQYVSTVSLTLVGTGTAVELRAADAPGATLDAYPVVTAAARTGTSVTLTAGSAHRYWLVWLTSLPAVPGGFRGGIAEMIFRS